MLKQRPRWQRWGLEALGILAIVLAVQAWQARGLPEGPAPALAGTTPEGKPLSLEGMVAGGKPVLVAFWATWCGVCKAEAGNLDAIARDRPFLAVAMQSGNEGEVARHLKDAGLRYPTVNDPEGEISRSWKVRSVPTHFVVDGRGVIRYRVVGYATEWGLRARLWLAEHLDP